MVMMDMHFFESHYEMTVDRFDTGFFFIVDDRNVQAPTAILSVQVRMGKESWLSVFFDAMDQQSTD